MSDVCYFILEGEGTYNIDNKEYHVKKNYLFTIPKNTPYFDTGKMTLLSIYKPKRDADNIEYCD